MILLGAITHPGFSEHCTKKSLPPNLVGIKPIAFCFIDCRKAFHYIPFNWNINWDGFKKSGIHDMVKVVFVLLN